jgi:glutathione-regulated potassium-efflux system ancillary protein KefC/glutathione-regulated potassium-efflux system protein KefB
MSANAGLVIDQPLIVLTAVVGLMAIKAAVLFFVGKLSGLSPQSARNLAVALAQGGEFAFVLFAVAAGSRIMERELAELLVIVVTLSMAATPLALVLNDALTRRLERSKPQRPFDRIDEGESKVIIAGFGRVGQIVGRILFVRKIPFTALDISADQVETVRRFGSKVYYGDASRLELLHAARADKAELFVLAIDDVPKSLRTAELVRTHFPHLKIYARARDRFHAYRLMDIGCRLIMRETLLSSLEIAEAVLRDLGLPGWVAQHTVAMFRSHDEKTLERQHAVYHDETQLIQTSKQAAQELAQLFESDREDRDLSALGSSAPFSPSDVR